MMFPTKTQPEHKRPATGFHAQKKQFFSHLTTSSKASDQLRLQPKPLNGNYFVSNTPGETQSDLSELVVRYFYPASMK
jgi:hypothetical protein